MLKYLVYIILIIGLSLVSYYLFNYKKPVKVIETPKVGQQVKFNFVH